MRLKRSFQKLDRWTIIEDVEEPSGSVKSEFETCHQPRKNSRVTIEKEIRRDRSIKRRSPVKLASPASAKSIWMMYDNRSKCKARRKTARILSGESKKRPPTRPSARSTNWLLTWALTKN